MVPEFLFTGLLLVSSAFGAGEAAPIRGWGGTWGQARTASVRIYYELGQPPSPDRLRDLERAVQRLAGELGLDRRQLESFRRRPIEYLYVRDARQLRWFGVEDVDGMALAPERRILAARLPHEHELVHVLVAAAMEPSPPDNQPWLTEGLASYLGGHLGEDPAAVLATGDHVLDGHPGLIGSLMTVEGFRQSPLPAASCYAASARFVQYLDEVRGGRERLRELLHLLAGYADEIDGRPASIVETQLEGVYSTSFGELLADFDRWREANPPAGIVPVSPPARSPDLVLQDDDHELRWWIDSDGWVLAAIPRSGPVDLAVTWGTAAAAPPGLAAPSRRSGFELRLDADGGTVLEHDPPAVRLRWYGPPGEDGARTWYLPAAAVAGLPAPRATDAVLWSQPRFEVD